MMTVRFSVAGSGSGWFNHCGHYENEYGRGGDQFDPSQVVAPAGDVFHEFVTDAGDRRPEPGLKALNVATVTVLAHPGLPPGGAAMIAPPPGGRQTAGVDGLKEQGRAQDADKGHNQGEDQPDHPA